MRVSLLLLATALPLVGCTRTTTTTIVVQERVHVPTAEAQRILRSLEGQIYDDTTRQFGGGVWTVGQFAVESNPISGLGPFVRLERRGRDDVVIPLESDSDVSDFHRVITGEPARNLPAGALSENYRKIMGT